MSKKAMLIAGLSAALGAGALHTYLARFELEAAGGPPKSIVMITRDLALGEVITRAALGVRPLPEQYVEERHIAADDLERIIGARATTPVRSGATLLWSDLDVMQDGRTLSGLVRPGMRAFSLPQANVSFDGLLRPGDRVDVLFTSAAPGEGTTTLLENVLVLTVGGELGSAEDGRERERKSGRVTLSVSVSQARLLAQNEARGTLRLALRNPGDLVLAEDSSSARRDDERGSDQPERGASHAR